ncbi:hypothetical protein B0H11DRAFT_239529 [Mycena galericulata]|nr:hypothetical protein B0H11DRAFT_239529 [Mycena galericulata]
MSSSTHLDAILPMTDNYMQNIVRHEKNHEFRRYRISSSVQRIWFYLTAPLSHIAYICEIDPAQTRLSESDPPLAEDGLGNAEFNTQRDGEWARYDYAYRIWSVWKIKEPISLKTMKGVYGMKGAPRGLVYVPERMKNEVVWQQQECVWGRAEPVSVSSALALVSRGVDTPPAGEGEELRKRKTRSRSPTGDSLRRKVQHV